MFVAWFKVRYYADNCMEKIRKAIKHPRQEIPCKQFTSITLWAKLPGKEKNSRALVRQQTIPTERPPLVGEVSANFRG
jgi:hypothetical protein